jgi:hypothetical protein
MKMMILPLASLLLAGAGCATKVQTVGTDLVGPCSRLPAPQAVTGQLVVYSCREFVSALRPASDLDQPFDPDAVARVPYDIGWPDGQLLRHVRNDGGAFDPEPVTVAVPPGEYTVTSFVPGQGQVRLLVLIQPGQTTAVHLDESGNYLKREAPPDHLVLLPNGNVAGCRGRQGLAAR